MTTEHAYNLALDLKHFLDSARDDYSRKLWGNHGYYVSEFNSLLERAHNLDIALDLAIIKVADCDEPRHQSWSSGMGPIPLVPSMASTIRKLREVVNSAERLLRSVSSSLGLDPNKDISPLLLIESLCVRFHTVVRQLRTHRKDKPILEIEDEYDVQYLFHSLLRLHFDDIRAEEWTPSYAGGSARMDFLLKAEQVVIEIKKTRKGLDAHELGDQLIIDIERYSKHPNCKTLVCFVYDPEGRIANPRGVEADLNSRSDEEIKIVTHIKPA